MRLSGNQVKTCFVPASPASILLSGMRRRWCVRTKLRPLSSRSTLQVSEVMLGWDPAAYTPPLSAASVTGRRLEGRRKVVFACCSCSHEAVAARLFQPSPRGATPAPASGSPLRVQLRGQGPSNGQAGPSPWRSGSQLCGPSFQLPGSDHPTLPRALQPQKPALITCVPFLLFRFSTHCSPNPYTKFSRSAETPSVVSIFSPGS